MEELEKMQQSFAAHFGRAAEYTFFSPGRVNLIGEYTDYNGGHVFPCAISLGTYALAARRSDAKLRLFSVNLPRMGVLEFPVRGLKYNREYSWANYLLGVVRLLEDAGYALTTGFDVQLCGNLPNGAGLSSSASIEVLMAVLLNELCGFGLDRVTLVKLAQRAENEFVGMNCGIMDQFAVGMGKMDCAVFLDCQTLQYRYSHIDLKGASIVIVNTNKRHSLTSSGYNDRRRDCEAALADLQRVRPIQALGELTPAEFDALAQHIKSPVGRRRARHAVYENARTIEAVAALEADDVAKFGRLMHDSHVSLRDDYEVSCRELDTLAELAWRQPGVIGARMTGGGFGGCTVNLVENAAIPAFEAALREGYTKAIGYEPSFYVANIADGAGRVK